MTREYWYLWQRYVMKIKRNLMSPHVNKCMLVWACFDEFSSVIVSWRTLICWGAERALKCSCKMRKQLRIINKNSPTTLNSKNIFFHYSKSACCARKSKQHVDQVKSINNSKTMLHEPKCSCPKYKSILAPERRVNSRNHKLTSKQ